MVERAKLLCRLPDSDLDWRRNALRCLSAICLGRAQLTRVPTHIVMPEVVAFLCDQLWKATTEGNPPKEWIAFLLTTNELDIFCSYDEGEMDSVACDVRSLPGGGPLGLLLEAHTHPNLTYPSIDDLRVLISESPEHLHAAAQMVVAGPHTFLMLRDERGSKPSAWVYYSSDRRNFRRIASEELARVYGAG